MIPVKLNDYKQDVLKSYVSYLSRFSKIGRELSLSDKKVIYLSQLLTVLSKTNSDTSNQILKNLNSNEIEQQINLSEKELLILNK